jgi:4-amino-4-deoxy-L-arabinose transferase-like glycosyltransferase
MIKDEKFDLILLLLVSILLGTYLFFQTYVISLDGAFQYIPIAKEFASGFFGKGLQGYGQQPLYPFFIAMASHLIGDFEVAGKLVSTLFGMLLIFPVYYLGKKIFDQKIAFLSALFLVIHPYIRRFSADVLKESTYLFFLATAIWFAWRTVEKDKIYPYFFIPIFSAMAYLVRPDGMEVLLVGFFYTIFIKKFNVPGRKSVAILLILLSSTILFLPFLLHLREATGEWTLSKSKSIGGILGWGVTGSELSLISRVLYSIKKLNFEIIAIYHPLYISLLIVGLWKRISSLFKNGEGFLIAISALHYGVLFLLILNLTNWSEGEKTQSFVVSGRHVLPLFLISIYWVGEGFLTIYHWIYKKIESQRLFLRLESRRRSNLVFVTLLILILAIVLPKTLKPQRYERLSEKWAGIWIKNQSGKGMTIFTTVHRVPYYADGNCEYIDFKKDKWDKVEASIVEKGGSYLVIRQRDIIDFPNETGSIKNNFIEVIRYEKKGMEKIIVYKSIE